MQVTRANSPHPEIAMFGALRQLIDSFFRFDSEANIETLRLESIRRSWHFAFRCTPFGRAKDTINPIHFAEHSPASQRQYQASRTFVPDSLWPLSSFSRTNTVKHYRNRSSSHARAGQLNSRRRAPTNELSRSVKGGL